MQRRTFLQLTGLTAAGVALSGCQAGNEKLIPFLVPPDEGVTPGLATYYASSCRSCPAGCGILVRVSEGRAKKIEGNPRHPINRGKLCARGQAALQLLYHPDRIQQPLKRSGARGSGAFTKITWGEALDLVATRLKALQEQQRGDALALLTPEFGGTLDALGARFMAAFGSPHHYRHELLSPGWLRTGAAANYGLARLPFYDLAETRYLLSFGADFIDSHLSPVHYGLGFGRMRQGRATVRGHFTYVGGRMSLTGASADRWLPAKPGSEGILALGLARLILAEGLHHAESLAETGLLAEELLVQLAGYTPAEVAEQTGLSQRAIEEVAREFATTHPALALAGETVATQSNGPGALQAIQLLNLLCGSLNQPGGVYPDAAGDPTATTTASLAPLLTMLERGSIELALIHGNPLHHMPAVGKLREGLAKVPYLVSFSSLLDDTALQADLILPDHTPLESWGDVIPRAGSRSPLLGLQQPVVRPLFDTRAFPEVLLTLAAELGGPMAAALPHPSYLALLQESVKARIGLAAGEDFTARWVSLLQQGGIFEQPTTSERFRWSAGSQLALAEPPSFSGEEKFFPLQLQVYPSTALYDGRGAPLPWLQQLPDPMTTVVWGSWVEINPQTAASLGIAQGDPVTVSSPHGSLRLPAVLYPGIRPDLVAIPLGQGQQGGGRYAQGRGINPLDLLAPAADWPDAGPWQATRVQIALAPGKADLVTAGHPEGSYRSELIGI